MATGIGVVGVTNSRFLMEDSRTDAYDGDAFVWTTCGGRSAARQRRKDAVSGDGAAGAAEAARCRTARKAARSNSAKLRRTMAIFLSGSSLMR